MEGRWVIHPISFPDSATYLVSMNHNLQKKRMTFGGLIESVYEALPQRKAQALVRLAVNSHVITFRKPRRFNLS